MRHLSLFLFLLFVELFSELSAFSLEAGLGYRNGKFDFNIAGPNGYPNIMSELEWKDLETIDFFGKIDWCSSLTWESFLWLELGFLFNGRVKDSDYVGDNRQKEWARGLAESNVGIFLELQWGTGRPFFFFNNHFTIRPLLGLSLRTTSFGIGKGEAHVFYPPEKPTIHRVVEFEDVHNLYLSSWFGGWLGFDYTFCSEKIGSIQIGHEFHKVFHRGGGFWNGGEGFFSHHSHGFGLSHRITLHYPFKTHWFANLLFRYEHWWIRPGWKMVYCMLPYDAVTNEEMKKIDYDLCPEWRDSLIHTIKCVPLNREDWKNFLFVISVGRCF